MDSVVMGKQFCYLTTVGRKSGRAHTVEIWFAGEDGGGTIYILAGGRYNSDWVRNIVANSGVEAMIADKVFVGAGRVVNEPEEERLARRLVVEKYYGRREVRSKGWEAESLPVAIDLQMD